MKLILSFLLMSVVSLPHAFAYGDDCQLNGKPVNLNNGNSTAGQTGTVICKDSGKVVREMEYQNGKHIGREMVITPMGEKVEKVVNEKGNSDGVEKHYDRKGTLITEGNFKNSREQGMQKKYNMKGKLESLEWAENGQVKFHVSYDKDGKPSDLKCGDKSYTPEDVDLCGFNGKTSNVKLSQYKDKDVVYKNGKMVESSTYDDKGNLEQHEKINGDSKEVTELFPDGKVKIQASYIGHALNGEEKEFHNSGKLIRKTSWNKGQMESEWTYYLNGSNQSHSAREQKGKNWFLTRELFWDNSKLKDSGTFQEKTHSYSWRGFSLNRWTYNSPVGEHKVFYENGQLQVTEIYDDSGSRTGTWKYFWQDGKPASENKYVADKLRATKEWDDKGVVTKDEEYYEDGSRMKK